MLINYKQFRAAAEAAVLWHRRGSVRQMFCKGLFVAALSGVLATGAQAQEKVRIGVLNDQTGVFATYQGLGSVVAAQMAVEDYGGKAAGKVVEVIAADHQNKPDIGVGIARRW